MRYHQKKGLCYIWEESMKNLKKAMVLYRLGRQILRIWYLNIRKDTITLTRILGVNLGGCKVIGDPFAIFGSEPWLITLGNHVEISNNVSFITHEGAVWVLRGLKKELNDSDKFAPIKIGNNVFIGSGSLILPGVTIGENVIIGGHSVVTKDIPSNSVFAGVPARKISTIDIFEEKILKDLVDTKHLDQAGKKAYLLKNKPEWFM